jgi:hypothetical protein
MQLRLCLREPPHPRPFSRLREKGESGTVSSENDRGRFCRDRALACISERKSRQIPPAFLYLLGMQGLPVAQCEATSYGTPECVPMLPHDRISRHTDAPRSSPFNMVARTSADPYRSHTIGTPSLCKGEGWDGAPGEGCNALYAAALIECCTHTPRSHYVPAETWRARVRPMSSKTRVLLRL